MDRAFDQFQYYFSLTFERFSSFFAFPPKQDATVTTWVIGVVIIYAVFYYGFRRLRNRRNEKRYVFRTVVFGGGTASLISLMFVAAIKPTYAFNYFSTVSGSFFMMLYAIIVLSTVTIAMVFGFHRLMFLGRNGSSDPDVDLTETDASEAASRPRHRDPVANRQTQLVAKITLLTAVVSLLTALVVAVTQIAISEQHPQERSGYTRPIK